MGKRRKKKGGGGRETKNKHRINERIRVPEVRVVDDDGDQGVFATEEALKKAQDQDLDLVEISPKAEPPVCKIIDYNKFLYEQKKKQKAFKAKQQKVSLKEIRFGPNTHEHDFNFKLEHAKKFLQEGHKVKAFVFFKGRSIVFKDQGEYILLRLANELEEYGTVESMPTLEGKRMIMMISPKKKKN